MVTFQEIKEKIFGRRKEFEEERAKVEAFRPTIYRTKEELLAASPMLQVQVRELQRLRGISKEQALAELGVQKTAFEAAVTPVETEMARVEAARTAYVTQKREWEVAQKYVSRKMVPSAVGGGIGKKMEEIYAVERAREDWLAKQAKPELVMSEAAYREMMEKIPEKLAGRRLAYIPEEQMKAMAEYEEAMRKRERVVGVPKALWETGLLGIPVLKKPIEIGIERLREFERRRLERPPRVPPTPEWMRRIMAFPEYKEEARVIGPPFIEKVLEPRWIPYLEKYITKPIIKPIIKRLPEKIPVPLIGLPGVAKIPYREYLLEEPAPKWAEELTEYMLRIAVFGIYMGTGVAKTGKAKPKAKAKAELLKRASPKAREKVVMDLDKIMKGKYKRITANKKLLNYIKNYRDRALAKGADPDIIRGNLKDMMEYAQSKEFLMLKVRPEVIAPPEGVYYPYAEAEVLPTIPVEKIAPSVYAGLGLYERYDPMEEFYPEYFRPPIRRPPVPTPIGAETMFTGIAPEGKIEVEKFGRVPAMGTLGKMAIGVGLGVALAPALTTAERLRAEEQARLRELERLREVERARLGITPALRPALALTPALALAPALTTVQQARLRQIELQKLIPKPREPFRPVRPRPKPPIGFYWWLPSEERARLRRELIITPPKKAGWNVYGKQIKTGRYKKLNVVPLSKSHAQSLGAYIVDRSLSVCCAV